MIKPGQPVPDVSGVLSDGRPLALASAKGRPLVLFFYPRAFGRVCTREACLFRDGSDEVAVKLGARIIGVSRDAPDTLVRFKAQYKLPYELLSDVSGDVTRAFGVELFGGVVPYARRATVVADAQGVVRAVFEKLFDAGFHFEEAKGTLEELAELAAKAASESAKAAAGVTGFDNERPVGLSPPLHGANGT